MDAIYSTNWQAMVESYVMYTQLQSCWKLQRELDRFEWEKFNFMTAAIFDKLN